MSTLLLFINFRQMMMKNGFFMLRTLLSVLSGMLTTLAFAPFNIFPFAVIGIALLLASLWQCEKRTAFWLGFLFGLGYFGAGVYWVFISIHLYGNVASPIALLITAGLIAILACYPAFVCYLTTRYFASTATIRHIFAFPALWVISEWLRSWLFSGFPWLFLGYGQTLSPLKGYAPLLSVYGTSFAVLLSAGLLFNTWLYYREKNFRSLYFSLLLCTSIWVLGALLTLIQWTQPVGEPLHVSLVQGNIPQSLKWDPTHLQLSLDRYVELTQPLWKQDQLIIWPEAAIPLSLKEAAPFIEALDKKANATHSQLVLGIPIENPDGKGYYNGIITVGEYKQTYLKRFLVPFGEYIPSILFTQQLFNFMDIPMSTLIAGKIYQKAFTFNNTIISPSICFEIAFPELIRLSNTKVGALLTITNDAWFGYSTAQAQHLQIAAMRAIENGRPVIFASNDGISAIIGPQGQIEAEAPAHQTTVLNAKVQAMNGMTPWMRYSMSPMLIIMMIMLFSGRRLSRKTNVSLIPLTTSE